eukprot:m.339918 g.339918  ORF g.339918 m.339918 type:complete len:281 (+) comp19037_c0_seq1:120-962(+)
MRAFTSLILRANSRTCCTYSSTQNVLGSFHTVKLRNQNSNRVYELDRISSRRNVVTLADQMSVPPTPKEAWVYDLKDKEPFSKSSIVPLNENVFGAPPRLDILHRVVVWQRREWWQGTAKTKNRSEVRGGGKKPWKQKGTGRARVSSIRSPLWRGGGVVHGPRPRDHRIKLPNKVHLFAFRVMLSVKYAQGDLIIVDDLDLETYKTKELVDMMSRNELGDSVLFVDGVSVPRNLDLAVRNIQNCAAISIEELTVYEMLLRPRLVLTMSAVRMLESLLTKN